MILKIQTSQAEHSLEANLSIPIKKRQLTAQWIKVDEKLVCIWKLSEH